MKSTSAVLVELSFKLMAIFSSKAEWRLDTGHHLLLHLMLNKMHSVSLLFNKVVARAKVLIKSTSVGEVRRRFVLKLTARTLGISGLILLLAAVRHLVGRNFQ